jgi:hypothetical protein
MILLGFDAICKGFGKTLAVVQEEMISTIVDFNQLFTFMEGITKPIIIASANTPANLISSSDKLVEPTFSDDHSESSTLPKLNLMGDPLPLLPLLPEAVFSGVINS